VKLDARTIFAPVVAALMLLLVLNITLGAIRTAGLWAPEPRQAPAPPDNPFDRIDRMLARQNPGPDPAGTRDPFAFGGATPVPNGPPRPRPAPIPPAPAQPVLTSIVWDSDPRATVRFGGHDYSVRPGSLFADFRVVSITQDQVVLDRGGVSLALRLPLKGD